MFVKTGFTTDMLLMESVCYPVISQVWTGSLAVGAVGVLAYCAEDHGLRPT